MNQRQQFIVAGGGIGGLAVALALAGKNFSVKDKGVDMAYPDRRATHEFIATVKTLKDENGVTAMDVAKRLLDKGFHAPTVYFPLLVPECFLIEPTETESKEELDGFIQAFTEILDEARADPEMVKSAPYTTPVRRLDEVRAARETDLAWRGS